MKRVLLKSRTLLSVTMLGFLLLFTGQGWAAEAEPGFPVIAPENLKSMVDAGGDAFVVIDARTPEEYQEAHITGAINVPAKEFAEHQNLLPADKNKQLIFYCNGVKCGKSKKAAEKAKELGYANIQVFAQGLPVWEELNYPVVAGPEYAKKIETTKLSAAELQQMIDSGKAGFTIVDVRDAAEYSEGHIPGAINIPVENFAVQSGVLDKEKKIVVYCNTGSRSYLAFRKLKKLAYPNIYQALMADWKEAGKPVEK